MRRPSNLLLDDFAEGHAPHHTRDLDLHLVPDLGPGNENDEVLDPGDAVALATDVLDLAIIHLPFHYRRLRPGPLAERPHGYRLGGGTGRSLFNHTVKRDWGWSCAFWGAHVVVVVDDRPREADGRDQEDDADDEDDQPGRGHEAVERAEVVEVGAADVDAERVREPGAEGEPRAADDDQAQPHPEQKGAHLPHEAPRPDLDEVLAHQGLPALGALPRPGDDDRAAARAEAFLGLLRLLRQRQSIRGFGYKSFLVPRERCSQPRNRQPLDLEASQGIVAAGDVLLLGEEPPGPERLQTGPPDPPALSR